MQEGYPVTPRPVYIYTLTDPREPDNIRYVGQSKNPRKRLNAHILNSQRFRYHNCLWIRSLTAIGVNPVLTIVEEATSETYEDAERRWIAYYRSIGCDLTNVSDGGDGAPKLSPEGRQRMADAARRQKGAKRSQEFKDRLSRANKGKQMSAESRVKMRAAKLGTVRSEEARRKQGEATRGRKLEPERVERSANARRKGYVLLSPSGERVDVFGLQRFCKANGLCGGNLITQSKKGLRSEGWFIVSETYPEPRERLNGQISWLATMGPRFTVTDPEGIEYHVVNLSEFCRNHGLEYQGYISEVSRGSRPHYRDWRVRPYGTPTPPVEWYHLKHKDGREATTRCLSVWCETNGLRATNMARVLSGEWAHLSG